MTYSPLCTETHATAQRSTRSQPVSLVVLHHAATTNADWVIRVESTGQKQVSSHAVVKDARIAGVVPEEFRAWSLSDALWDSRALTVECANESTDGWTISDASHETLARLVADWATRYRFHPHRDGDPRTWTVLGHREVHSIHGGSYATACPGGMDLDRITRRAQQLLTPPPPVIDPGLIRRQKEPSMYVKGQTYPTVYNVFTDANGHPRLRACENAEASYATIAGLVTPGDDATLSLLAKQTGYQFAQPIELPTVKVAE